MKAFFPTVQNRRLGHTVAACHSFKVRVGGLFVRTYTVSTAIGVSNGWSRLGFGGAYGLTPESSAADESCVDESYMAATGCAERVKGPP